MDVICNTHFIEALNQVIFNKEEVHLYQGYFQEIADKGKIADGTFNADIWKVYYNGKKVTTFKFDIDMYPEFKLALKCFTIIGLYSGCDPSNFNSKINHLKNIILHTQGFSGDNVDSKLERWFISKSENVLLKIVPSVSQFISFCSFDDDGNLNESCINFYPGFLPSVRTLPKFLDVITFDSIIIDFMKNSDCREKLIYFPIILWWKITLIIPMRTSEFCSLSYNCTSKKNEEYFLTIPRIKRKRKTSQDIDVTDCVRINKDIYELIREYKQKIKRFNKTPYLLSYEAYMQSWDAKPNHNSYIAKANKDKFEPAQLYRLLKNFYEAIVNLKYVLPNLNRIKPMDTRHYAFCNMMLQGFNMLSIARIGGHHKLEAQMHYFQHLDHFSESSIQYLSDQYKKLYLISQFPEHPMLTGQERILRASSILDNSSFKDNKYLHKVEYGYCKHDPEQCPVGDCRHCKYFVIPTNKLSKDVYQWLCNESDRLAARIKEQIELMSRLSQNMAYNLVTLDSDPVTQAELSYLATNSKKLREQKAMNDAHRDIVKDYLFGVDQNDKGSR